MDSRLIEKSYNILVTGGAGFIGSHLVDRLVKEDYQVVVLDNLRRGRLENIQQHLDQKRIRFIEGDLRNPDDVENAVKQCDVVFHLAAQSNVLGAIEDLDYSFQSNVTGTFNLLKACQKHSIKRLVFTSSREAYGEAQYLPVDEKHPLESKNTYGASKIGGEVYCRVFENMDAFEVIILRLANVYGTRDFNRVIPIFFDNTAKNDPIRIYGGQQVIDFISVEIVVEALVQSMFKSDKIESPVNVGSGRGTTLFDLAERIKTLTKSESEIQVKPARSAEVVKFIASTKKMLQTFDISLPEDPLYYLPNLLEVQR